MFEFNKLNLFVQSCLHIVFDRIFTSFTSQGVPTFLDILAISRILKAFGKLQHFVVGSALRSVFTQRILSKSNPIVDKKKYKFKASFNVYSFRCFRLTMICKTELVSSSVIELLDSKWTCPSFCLPFSAVLSDFPVITQIKIKISNLSQRSKSLRP